MSERVTLEKITALAKRRGFIYPSSEIYGGIKGFWDYGPLGTELKNNIKKEWWKNMVYQREDVIGVDAAVIMNPQVWEASGHLEVFTDPLVECKVCHKRFRRDMLDQSHTAASALICSDGKQHSASQLTEEKKFNLMTEAYLGVTEPKDKVYLRGEITQGVFVNFNNIVTSTRVKIPFGVAQIGKAFRNEITPGNLTYRSREFEQMELEYFIKPGSGQGKKVFDYWKKERMKWYVSLGLTRDNLRFREHAENERAHYAKFAIDIEYKAPFGWSEFEGIHNRGDWDLSRHKLTYKDDVSGEEFVPWVIETSGGVDRSALFFLLDAYYEDEKRVVLKLHPKLAPYKAAVFPLVSNKQDIVKAAKGIYKTLTKGSLNIAWDARGNIGKRYLSQDEIGTPFCITTDYQTLEDRTITVRDRDTMKQERVAISKLPSYIEDKAA